MLSPWILTLSLLSVILLVGIPLSFARPLLRKGKGVRRETVYMEKGSETAEQGLRLTSTRTPFDAWRVSSDTLAGSGWPQSWTDFVSDVSSIEGLQGSPPFISFHVFQCLRPTGTSFSLRGVSMYS